MDYEQLIEKMPEETYQNLKRAVELGKWPDGRVLTREQRENTLHAIIAWGKCHLQEREQVGFIDKKDKEGDECDSPEETPLTWKD